MKANELRVGNLISHNKTTQEVISIFTYIDNTPTLMCAPFERETEITEFEPIPLTEEWLGKFGFVLQTDDSDEPDNLCKTFWSIPTKDYFNFDSEFNSFIHCGMELCRVDFIHQLQNLYFALTGEELTIKK